MSLNGLPPLGPCVRPACSKCPSKIGIVGVVIPLAILIFGSDLAFATFPFWKGLASRGIGKNLSDGSQPLDHSHPPCAKREEERVFHAGVAPPFWDTSFPRQAETSQEPMIDPTSLLVLVALVAAFQLQIPLCKSVVQIVSLQMQRMG
jgi:hypothetical protein